MRGERGRTRLALVGFLCGALLAGVSLSAYLLVRGTEAASVAGIATLPTDRAGWWALVGLSAALGAAVGTVGALAGWVLSRPWGFGNDRAPSRRTRS